MAVSLTKILLIPVSWRSFPALPGPEHAGIRADQIFSGVPADYADSFPTISGSVPGGALVGGAMGSRGQIL